MGKTNVRVEIKSLAEIDQAYREAIALYVEDKGEVWSGKIRLLEIEFESNFRRSNYFCIFEMEVDHG